MYLVSSFRAGNFLDSGSESGVEVLESINVESALLRAGNLLELDVEHVIRYSHCVQLDVLETSVVGRSSHVVLKFVTSSSLEGFNIRIIKCVKNLRSLGSKLDFRYYRSIRIFNLYALSKEVDFTINILR